jgi:hypothetical protein
MRTRFLEEQIIGFLREAYGETSVYFFEHWKQGESARVNASNDLGVDQLGLQPRISVRRWKYESIFETSLFDDIPRLL